MSRELAEYIRANGLESMGIFLSTYRAIVVSNSDPENLGRLKVNCPILWNVTSTWLQPKGVKAGNKSGKWDIPQPGDLVYITCIAGDANDSVWEYGGWFKGKTIPGATVNNRIEATPKGITQTMDDSTDFYSVINKAGAGITVMEKSIITGQKTGALHPEILGDKLNVLLNKLITLIYTSNAGGYPLSNSVALQNLISELNQHLSINCSIKE